MNSQCCNRCKEPWLVWIAGWLADAFPFSADFRLLYPLSSSFHSDDTAAGTQTVRKKTTRSLIHELHLRFKYATLCSMHILRLTRDPWTRDIPMQPAVRSTPEAEKRESCRITRCTHVLWVFRKSISNYKSNLTSVSCSQWYMYYRQRIARIELWKVSSPSVTRWTIFSRGLPCRT